MSTHQTELYRQSPLSHASHNDYYAGATKIVTAVALLALGYYATKSIDIWPETTKRFIYEAILYVLPSRLIYAVQSIMVRCGRLDETDATFKKADFGNMMAKAGAVRTMMGRSQMPLAFQKMRSLSQSFTTSTGNGGPAGLGNWDNSCYQNSVLQGFASLSAFFEYIELSDRLCDKYGEPGATHRALKSFLGQLAESNCSSAVLWTPNVLKSMNSWQQQDAQEYFSRVLEAVEKEAKQYAVRLRHSSSPGLEGLSLSSKELHVPTTSESQADADQDRPVCASGLKHELRNPIEGMTSQGLRCINCGFTEGLSLTQFNCLTLNMGTRGGCYLETLLDELTEVEYIDGVECDNCTRIEHGQADISTDEGDKAKSEASESMPKKKPVLRTKSKQVTIARLPKNLVFHINRSIFNEYGDQLKNTAPVSYPRLLGIPSSWCIPLALELEDSNQALYELKCVVTHYGSHHDGHYVACGKRSKEWYCFNDERVTRMSEDEVLSRTNAFMLFYEALPLLVPNETPQSGPKPGLRGGDKIAEAEEQDDEFYSDEDGMPPLINERHLTVDTNVDRLGTEGQQDRDSGSPESSSSATRETTPATSFDASPTTASAHELDDEHGKKVEGVTTHD